MPRRSCCHLRPRRAASALGFEVLEGRDLLAAGVLDTTFGLAGKVVSAAWPGGATLRDVAVQQDMKIVAVAQVVVGNETVFGTARFNADGSLDTSFGTGGKVITDVPGTNNDGPAGMAI